MIMHDEKIVIKELERNEGELTQSDLVRKTKLSKVKVHRIIKRLESLFIVSKYPYGVTNKIKLERACMRNKRYFLLLKNASIGIGTRVLASRRQDDWPECAEIDSSTPWRQNTKISIFF